MHSLMSTGPDEARPTSADFPWSAARAPGRTCAGRTPGCRTAGKTGRSPTRKRTVLRRWLRSGRPQRPKIQDRIRVRMKEAEYDRSGWPFDTVEKRQRLDAGALIPDGECDRAHVRDELIGDLDGVRALRGDFHSATSYKSGLSIRPVARTSDAFAINSASPRG